MTTTYKNISIDIFVYHITLYKVLYTLKFKLFNIFIIYANNEDIHKLKELMNKQLSIDEKARQRFKQNNIKSFLSQKGISIY